MPITFSITENIDKKKGRKIGGITIRERRAQMFDAIVDRYFENTPVYRRFKHRVQNTRSFNTSKNSIISGMPLSNTLEDNVNQYYNRIRTVIEREIGKIRTQQQNQNVDTETDVPSDSDNGLGPFNNSDVSDSDVNSSDEEGGMMLRGGAELAPLSMLQFQELVSVFSSPNELNNLTKFRKFIRRNGGNTEDVRQRLLLFLQMPPHVGDETERSVMNEFDYYSNYGEQQEGAGLTHSRSRVVPEATPIQGSEPIELHGRADNMMDRMRDMYRGRPPTLPQVLPYNPIDPHEEAMRRFYSGDITPNELRRVLNTPAFVGYNQRPSGRGMMRGGIAGVLIRRLVKAFNDAKRRWNNGQQTPMDYEREWDIYLSMFEDLIDDIENGQYTLREDEELVMDAYVAWLNDIRLHHQDVAPADVKGGALNSRMVKLLLQKSYDKTPSSHGKFEIDPELSGERVQVYKKKGSNQAVVVHRGTKGIHDIGNDIKYALGFDISNSDRMKHARDIQKKAEEKYGASNITTLGHSLGSKISSEVGKNSHEIINLNKAVAPQDLFKEKNANEYNLRTTNDLVSYLLPLAHEKNVKTIPSLSPNPFTEHKVDVLDRIEPQMLGRGHIEKLSKKHLKDVIKKLPKTKDKFKVAKKTKKELVDYCCSRCVGGSDTPPRRRTQGFDENDPTLTPPTRRQLTPQPAGNPRSPRSITCLPPEPESVIRGVSILEDDDTPMPSATSTQTQRIRNRLGNPEDPNAPRRRFRGGMRGGVLTEQEANDLHEVHQQFIDKRKRLRKELGKLHTIWEEDEDIEREQNRIHNEIKLLSQEFEEYNEKLRAKEARREIVQQEGLTRREDRIQQEGLMNYLRNREIKRLGRGMKRGGKKEPNKNQPQRENRMMYEPRPDTITIPIPNQGDVNLDVSNPTALYRSIRALHFTADPEAANEYSRLVHTRGDIAMYIRNLERGDIQDLTRDWNNTIRMVNDDDDDGLVELVSDMMERIDSNIILAQEREEEEEDEEEEQESVEPEKAETELGKRKRGGVKPLIDFEHVKWGSFSKQFDAYKHQHPKNKVNDLKEFADMILKNPEKYQEKTKKRARFYLNVLLKNDKKVGGAMDYKEQEKTAFIILASALGTAITSVTIPALWKLATRFLRERGYLPAQVIPALENHEDQMPQAFRNILEARRRVVPLLGDENNSGSSSSSSSSSSILDSQATTPSISTSSSETDLETGRGMTGGIFELPHFDADIGRSFRDAKRRWEKSPKMIENLEYERKMFDAKYGKLMRYTRLVGGQGELDNTTYVELLMYSNWVKDLEIPEISKGAGKKAKKAKKTAKKGGAVIQHYGIITK